MTAALWRLGAVDLAGLIRRKDVSAREAATSVLDRIDAINPRINALADVLRDSALAAADAADRALARGAALGPLHGVPVTIKINIDVEGRATTGGVTALKDLVAASDAPVTSNLRRAGAVIVGRSNTPSFSLRWFTDNDLHGRTLNPWNAAVTPGGSSGGAAAAAALGMGAIHHGNDYGGSIRYPAWACGAVGMRPTAGRVPAANATARDERIVTNQMMSVQGPLTRDIADARLALVVMAAGDARDPLWVPAPLEYPAAGQPLKVALFKRWSGCAAEPSVVAALEQAARWLADAGCIVEEAEPPHFEEATSLWRQLVHDDMRRGGKAAIEAWGDDSVKKAFGFYIGGIEEWDRDRYLQGLSRRLTIARAWSLFYAQYPVLLMPVSWERQFPIDDDTRSQARMERMLAAQSPLLATAGLGLPGLAVPTGLVDGLPVGVQLCATRYREDICLNAGAIVERAARFSALDRLAPG
jgi:amidase